MASTISSRPSHYEALGLSPAATQDEIARAFAKAMTFFGARSAAAAAQIGMAFETLRNPEKRRAYDESLGLRRAPAPAPAPTALSFRISAPAAAPEPHVEPAVEPAADSFIASSLREIARPVELSPSSRPTARPEPPAARAATPPTLMDEDTGEDLDRPFDWRRPAVGVGAVVLAAGLGGGLAGVSVRDDVQGQAAVTAALPSAKARPHVIASGAAEAPVLAQAVSAARERPAREEGPPARPKPISPPQSTAASPEVAQAVENAPDGPSAQPASEQAAADPLAPKPETSLESVAVAGLPLASKTVERTIERIGYDCGAVASTTPIEGAAGVYKVTCTSGQTFRAAPVHGRYRFKRW